MELPQKTTTQTAHPARPISRRALLTGLGVAGALTMAGAGGLGWLVANDHTPSLIVDITPDTLDDITAVVWSPDSRFFGAIESSSTVAHVWQREPFQKHLNLTDINGQSLAWSPDGRYLALPFAHTIALWDAHTGKFLSTFSKNTSVFDGFLTVTLRWSPDGRTLASGHLSGQIAFWDVERQRLLHVFETGIGRRMGYGILDLAWSPDGTSVVVMGARVEEMVAIWQVNTGMAQALPLPMVADPQLSLLSAVAWSLDGKHIVAGFQGGRIGGQIVHWSRQGVGAVWRYHGRIEAHALGVGGLAWSPDSTRFVSVGGDQQIQFWRASDDRLLQTYQNASAPQPFLAEPRCVAWSPDGTAVLIGDGIGRVSVWDVK